MIAPLFTPLSALAAPLTSTPLDRGWQVRIDPADKAMVAAHPAAARWLTAIVPGTVQQDLIRARIVPDPFLGTNEAAIQWAGLTDWQYRTTLTIDPASLRRDHLDLVFDGLDTFATVRVNGRALLSVDNAHRRCRADAKPLLHAGANVIEIDFASPIRKLQPMVLATASPLPGEYDSAFGDEPKGKQTSPYIRKPKYHYGWDWGPRIVAIGPWRDVRLEAWDSARLDRALVDQEAVSAAEARLTVRATVVADAPREADVAVEVTGPDGRRWSAARRAALVAGSNIVSLPLTIDRPRLWQPAGYGAQPLYTVSTRLDGGQAIVRRTGLRTVELIRGGGAFGLKINGIPIFMKGANVIPFDVFPSRVDPATERRILTDARDSNMNMVRVWGGGYYPDDRFYDIADELGLMVWQDFMFGGAVPPPDAAYRASVAAEADEQVARLQAHPSLVIWTGGNEVLSGWANWSDRRDFAKAIGPDAQEQVATGMTVLFDRVLRDAVLTNDIGVPYWPGSPSTDYDGPVDTDASGDRHYWDVWSGSKPIENYTDACPRFMSEYGFQGMPDLSTVARFAGTPDLTSDSPVMKAHQKFLAGEGNSRILFYLKDYYRQPRDFADLDYLSQAMQAEAIGLAARHHRACRPTTMGSLFWQLNDDWPAISWASIDWYGQWKLLQYNARRFFAPQAIVAEHRDGATKISLLSDSTRPIAARWRLTAMTMDGRTLHDETHDVTLPPLSATEVAKPSDAALFGSAPPQSSYAVAALEIDGRTVSRLVVERLRPRQMAYPSPGLTVRWQGKSVTLTAQRLARAVGLSFGTVPAHPSDNGFDLLPGETRTIAVDSAADAAALARALRVSTLGPQ
ncbi:glycoside hydrolase family 2 protein [Sphingomonas sp. ASV193]|uniref:beta-mannosidase n=1 Tax=Sphingomonas sp. ASV193 TaxID=3144405 RepID=UPI0032E931CA